MRGPSSRIISMQGRQPGLPDGIGDDRMAPAFLKKLSLSALLAAAIAVPASANAPAFDQARIRADYRDGEFEKVITGLRGFLKTGRTCSRSDSVFLAKHLAVVYAAHPDTRELGRHYMFRLLRTEPDADLLDMYVGQEVDRVFEKVRREHILNAAEIAKRTPAGIPADPAFETPVPARSAEHSHGGDGRGFPEGSAPVAAWRDPSVWIGGGAALAVVAFTLYFSAAKQEPQATTYTTRPSGQ